MRPAGQPQRHDEQERAERDRRPITHDARQPVPAARDAPDVVERLLDAAQQRDRREHQQHHAGHAQRAAAGGLNKLIDAAGDFLARGDGLPLVRQFGQRYGVCGGRRRGCRKDIGRDRGSGSHVVGFGGFTFGGGGCGKAAEGSGNIRRQEGRGRQAVNQPLDELVDALFSFAFQEGACDADRHHEHRNERQQRVVGQRRCAHRAAIADETLDCQGPEVGESLQPGKTGLQ